MTDNLLIPISGGTATAATEDVGGAHYQKMILTNEAHAAYRGRAQSFRIPGLAGTAGQKLLSLWNGSTRVVHINKLTCDLVATVIKAVTVQAPAIRVQRVTAAPTGGAALAKVSKDSALTADALVVLLQGASAEGTGATLSATPTGTLSQEWAPRLITAAGYEMFDRAPFLEGDDVVLRANEGIIINLDYSLATQNPATDVWLVGVDWYEVA